MASDAGRDVGAVPGPVTAGAAAGTNELISSGAALIRGGQDILDRMLGAGAGQPLFGPEITRREAETLEAVEAGCLTVDEVAAKLESGAGEVAMTLARLEVRGYLRGSAVGTWTRTSLAAYPSAGETVKGQFRQSCPSPDPTPGAVPESRPTSRPLPPAGFTAPPQ